MLRRYFQQSNYIPPPPITLPPADFVFATAGPNKVTYQKSGNTVVGAVLSTGQQLVGNYTLTTEIDAAHNNAEVLVCGYGSFLEQAGILPAGFYGNGARCLIYYLQVPVGQNRELVGYGATNFMPMQQFDLVSLPGYPDPDAAGLGMHLVANKGTLPNLPTQYGLIKVVVQYYPDRGTNAAGPGRLTITDGVNTNSYDIGPLNTGTNPAQRRGIVLGLGGYIGNLSQNGLARIMHVEGRALNLDAGQLAVHNQTVNPTYTF